MFPKPMRRACLTVFLIFFFYSLLAFLATDLDDKEREDHQVVLWNQSHSGHVIKRLQLAGIPDAATGQDAAIGRDAASGLYADKNIGVDGDQVRRMVLARVWPSMANHSTGLNSNKLQFQPNHLESPTEPSAVKLPVENNPDENNAGCSNDCLRLKELWKTWPTDKPKAVIYYLIQAKRLYQMKQSLESVDAYFNTNFRYPIVIFHETDLIPLKETLRNYTTSDLYFQQVNFSIPSFLTKPVVFDIPCISAIGYRHMCRFNAKLVYEQSIMQGLDYHWRLDDDSYLLRPVTFDPFVFMRKKDIIYGYQWMHYDNSDCVKGLWEATEKYIKDNDIKPQFFDQWPKPRLFYNNFEISRLDVWTSPFYKKYIDYLDKLGGMYYHRWGDAPIRGLSLSLFVPMNKTYLFKEIGYRHTSFKNP